MMNFSNLTTRLLCVLLLVFLVFLAMVYWIIDQQAKPEVAKLTSQTIIETGNEAVNGILSRVSQIDGMAVTASRMTGSLPKNADIINTSVGNSLSQPSPNAKCWLSMTVKWYIYRCSKNSPSLKRTGQIH